MGGSNSSVTIADVAKRAGVSISTVSRALGSGPASHKTQEKVRKAAKELHFIPNYSARQLSSGRTGIIAFVVQERVPFIFNDPYISVLLSCLSAQCSDHGFLPFLPLAGPDDEHGMLEMLRQANPDGVIATSGHSINDFADSLDVLGKPVMFVGHPKNDRGAAFVDVDNYAAGYNVGRYLLSIGRRRVAVISGPLDMIAPQDRNRGLVDALEEQGLSPIAIKPSDFTAEGGALSMADLLAGAQRPDAVFAHSDLLAEGAAGVIRGAGLSIPQDIAIVGFDDIQVAGIKHASFTTCSQPIPEMAKVAVSVLVHRITSGLWGEPLGKLFKAPLKLWDSA